MKILLGNSKLQKTGGTENYVYALALELLRRGHEVEYFTFERGDISRRLEEEGVGFMSHTYYDLVLANHATVVDFLCNHGLVVQTCHGVLPAQEQPSPQADVHVAVTSEVAGHLRELGYGADVVLNGVDCERFAPRTPLNGRLTRVLSLCQSERANRLVRSCCEELGVEFAACNKHTDNVFRVEDAINGADLVVGVGRSVYDAMACGRCVVSFDFRDYMESPMGDGYLTEATIGASLVHNCTGRGQKRRFTRELLKEELLRYNAADGAWARQYALEHLNISKAADRYLAYFTEERKVAKMGVVIERFQQGREESMQSVYGQLARLKRKNREHLRQVRVLGVVSALLAVLLSVLLA